MKPRRAAASGLLALSVAACASPRDQLSSALETALSWVSTVRLVSGHWLAGRAPTRYTRATLETALRSLEEERARLTAGARTAADENVQQALPVVEEIERSVSRMWAALGRDRGRVEQERATLLALDERLRALGARPATP
jgi:hypothetical protein